MSCARREDAGAYLLHALPEDEARSFESHLAGCGECRDEMESLRVAVDTLPMAAPQMAPSDALKSRIMRVVESEAELLRAAGPAADVVPARVPWHRRRYRFVRNPLVPAAAAAALLAVGVVVGAALSGDSSPSSHVYAANVAEADAGATASLTVRGSHGTLRVADLPSAPRGKVYQVWLQRSDGSPPVPTHTLFDVRGTDGAAVVPIEEPVSGVRHVLVTPEPPGGSSVPTGPKVIEATIS